MRVVGQARPIHDARAKVCGRLRYTADLQPQGALWLAVIWSEVAHGYVRAVDDSAARALPGVVDVLHCLNTPDYRFNRYRSQFTYKSAYGTWTNDQPPEESVFARHVRFAGDRVGVVAAVDERVARRAAALVRVEYDELPCALTIDEALVGKNCLEGERAVVAECEREAGEELACAPGDVEVSAGAELARLHHVAMEPHACIASYDPDADELTIESPNQSVFGIRTVVADMLGMPYSRVRVIKAPMGGSFGGKQEWVLEPVCAVAARALGRPVVLAYTRAEAMRSTPCRAAQRMGGWARFSADGVLKDLWLDSVLDAGAYLGNGADYVQAGFPKLFRCYRLPHATLRGRVVQTNTPPSGAFRSWGVSETYTIVERLMDRAAEALGLDPVGLRCKNLLLPGELDVRTGVSLESIRGLECLERGAERFGWERRRAADEAFNAAGGRWRRGTAVACAGYTSTYYPRFPDLAGVRLCVCDDGSVQGSASIHDHGCGSITAFRMIVAEVLGIPEDLVRLKEADTATTPFDWGCYSSRSTFVIGGALERCARELAGQLLDVAAQMLGVAASRLYLEGGCVRSHDDESLRLALGEVSRWSIVELRREISVETHHHNDSDPGVTAAHFAQVEVDTWTGMTRVLAYLAVHDVGQAINAGMCEAQIQGAVQMGCGAALHEELLFDERGRCRASLAKYHVMNAPELPPIEVELVRDGPSAEGPFGAKSVGEICMVPVVPVVTAAVNRALGARIEAVPISPDRVMAWLDAQGEASAHAS